MQSAQNFSPSISPFLKGWSKVPMRLGWGLWTGVQRRHLVSCPALVLGCGHPWGHPHIPCDPGHLVPQLSHKSPSWLLPPSPRVTSQRIYTTHLARRNRKIQRPLSVPLGCGRGHGAEVHRKKTMHCFLLYKASSSRTLKDIPIHLSSSLHPCSLITTANTYLVLTRAGAVLCTLCVITHFIPTTTLSNRYCYYPSSLQKRKLSPREFRHLTPNHTAGKMQN